MQGFVFLSQIKRSIIFMIFVELVIKIDAFSSQILSMRGLRLNDITLDDLDFYNSKEIVLSSTYLTKN